MGGHGPQDRHVLGKGVEQKLTSVGSRLESEIRGHSSVGKNKMKKGAQWLGGQEGFPLNPLATFCLFHNVLKKNTYHEGCGNAWRSH